MSTPDARPGATAASLVPRFRELEEAESDVLRSLGRAAAASDFFAALWPSATNAIAAEGGPCTCRYCTLARTAELRDCDCDYCRGVPADPFRTAAVPLEDDPYIVDGWDQSLGTGCVRCRARIPESRDTCPACVAFLGGLTDEDPAATDGRADYWPEVEATDEDIERAGRRYQQEMVTLRRLAATRGWVSRLEDPIPTDWDQRDRPRPEDAADPFAYSPMGGWTPGRVSRLSMWGQAINGAVRSEAAALAGGSVNAGCYDFDGPISLEEAAELNGSDGVLLREAVTVITGTFSISTELFGDLAAGIARAIPQVAGLRAQWLRWDDGGPYRGPDLRPTPTPPMGPLVRAALHEGGIRTTRRFGGVLAPLVPEEPPVRDIVAEAAARVMAWEPPAHVRRSDRRRAR